MEELDNDYDFWDEKDMMGAGRQTEHQLWAKTGV